MPWYKIVDDSGVDYGMLGQEKGSWLGKIVYGNQAAHLEDCISVEKPVGGGTYTADKKCFEERESTPMKITLDEWLQLEEKARIAGQALRELDTLLIQTSIDHVNAKNNKEGLKLVQISKRVNEAEQALAADLFHVQSEWTGGPSENPRNFTLREPNWVAIAHAFPSEQVDKYRDELTGDIKIPHRQQKGSDA